MKRLAPAVLVLALAGCGWSPFSGVQPAPAPPVIELPPPGQQVPPTRPAPPPIRTAVAKVMRAEVVGQGLPKGVKFHVVSVRVATADPLYARAVVSLTGGPYGGGSGDEAAAVLHPRGGQWTIVIGPGTGFPDTCRKPEPRAIRQLLCAGSVFGR